MNKKHIYTILFCVLLNINFIYAQKFNYDFNTFTKIARIYTNNEIIFDFNVLSEEGLSKNIKFENGYILEFEDNRWIEKGFYNKNEIIYNKIAYKLKSNVIGRIFVKQETDKKWTKVIVKRNQLTIEKNGNSIPKTVEYLVLLQNTRIICLDELEQIKKRKIQERIDKKKEYEKKENNN